MEFLQTEAGTVGVFAIFAVLVLREVLLFLGKHPTQNGVDRAIHTVPAQCPVVTRMEGQVDELHEIHTARDADGVQLLPRLAQESHAQTELLQRAADGIDELVHKGGGT